MECVYQHTELTRTCRLSLEGIALVFLSTEKRLHIFDEVGLQQLHKTEKEEIKNIVSPRFELAIAGVKIRSSTGYNKTCATRVSYLAQTQFV